MSRKFLFLLGIVAAFGQPALAAEAEHNHGAMKGPEMLAQAELGAQAAFDAHGVLWAVHKVSDHIAVSRSDDRGQSWSNPVLVTRAPEPTDTGGDARPKIALGREGEIYLTWTKPMAEPYTGEITFARSLDGGRTFSTPIVVHRDRRVITHRFDTLAVNQDGKVFVAWIDKRDLVDAGNDPKAYSGAAIYFAVSDDRGASFRGDFKVADHVCECCRIALLARDDGTVTAMWRHVFDPNIRDHAIATLSADGKATAVKRVTFEDWRIDACPHHGPSLAADAAGQIHAVWFSGAAEHSGFFYGRLREGGVDGLRRLGSGTAGHGDVAVDGQRVVVVWKNFADGRSRILDSVSADGGKTWRDGELAAVDGTADYPRLLTEGHRFYVFWNSRDKPLQTLPVR
jgi:hypothetical protein